MSTLSSATKRTDSQPPDFEERFYDSHDGLSLYFRLYGVEGPWVLCLPGLTRNCKDFENLARHLAENYRVITPDLRGRGRSAHDPKWKRYLPPIHVQDCWTLLNELDIQQCTVIGTSLGGLLGMAMAEQHPERITALILNDVGPEVRPEALGRISEYVGSQREFEDWAAAVQATRDRHGHAFPDADDEFWAALARSTWKKNEDGKLVPDSDPAIANALSYGLKALKRLGWLQRFGVSRFRGMRLNPWDGFSSLTQPCLLLRGGLSDAVTEETVERMREMKPDLKSVTVPDRGHCPTLDEPASRAAIDDFLNRNST